MARVEYNVEQPKLPAVASVTVDLSYDEAASLRHILGSQVGGGPTSRIYNALADAERAYRSGDTQVVGQR